MANSKNYINNLWVNKVSDFEMYNMDITEDALKALNALTPNEKGVRKITIGAQKTNPGKYSVWENDYKPKQQAEGSYGSGDSSGTDSNLPF